MEKVRIGIVGAGNIATNSHMPAYAACDAAEIAAVADINLERAQAVAQNGLGFPMPTAPWRKCWQTNPSTPWTSAPGTAAIRLWRLPRPTQGSMSCVKSLWRIPWKTPWPSRLLWKRPASASCWECPAGSTLPTPWPGNCWTRGSWARSTMPRPPTCGGEALPTGWFTDKRASGGGPILDIGVHRIDAAWYLMGNPKPVRVSAVVSNKLGEFETLGVQRWQGTPYPDNRNDTEDFGAGVIHFENGAMLAFEAAWALNGPDLQFTQLFGTKGGITLDPLTVYGERNHYLSDDQLNPGPGERFKLEIAHFVECVRTGAETRFPIEQACQLQQMLQGIYDSAKLGREITL